MKPVFIVRWIMFAALLCSAGSAYAQGYDTVLSDPCDNTAMGYQALRLLEGLENGSEDSCQSIGSGNTAIGASVLYSNTTGGGNTAAGESALYSNTTGTSNTASGQNSLYYNTTGNFNTAVGESALLSNTTGDSNTAAGIAALFYNTTGSFNTADGDRALISNTTGDNNTAFGSNALALNSTGKGNAAQGVNALYDNTTGIRNLGIGSNALYSNVAGSYNVALGFDAGYNATGNDNIYINNQGVTNESQTLRMGTQGTSGVVGSGILSAYIAGIYNVPVSGCAVYVSSSGQLGCTSTSSERYKSDIATMPDLSSKLAELRPVTFHYKTDAKGTLQYGLIAEEVAKVYPELVIRGADGRIDGVRYEELAPMLLNEVQQQQRKIAEQEARIADQSQHIDRLSKLEQQVAELKQLVTSDRVAIR